MKIYVGNLPYSLTEQDLEDLFASYGKVVSAKLIINRETGMSKGFGFVEMQTKEEGETAIKELNAKDLDGREIVVNKARQKEKKDFNNNRSFRNNRY